MSKRVTGGDVVFRALKACGVTTVFSLPGAGVLPIYDACLTHGIRIIDGRHEGAVVQMAEGYARAARQPGVAILPEGPGLANGIGGIASAYAECSPVLILSALPPIAEIGHGARQELPQVEMCAPITKLSALVAEASRLSEAISKAFDLTMAGVPGPVHLSIPADVLTDRGSLNPLSPCAKRFGVRGLDRAFTVPDQAMARGKSGVKPPHSKSCPSGSGDMGYLADQAIDLLANAARPAIVAGSMVYWPAAEEALQEFVELTGIPLFTVERARGLIPDTHPLCFGDAYSSVNPVAGNLHYADVVLLLGEKIDCRFAYGHSFGAAKLIHVWPNAGEIGLHRKAEIGIPCNITAALEQMLSEAHGRAWREKAGWLQALRSARTQHQVQIQQLGNDKTMPLHPAFVAAVLGACVPADAMLVFDGGDVSGWGRWCLHARHPGDWQLSTILGQMGTGLPFAIGGAIARPERPVVLLTGDGALGFSIMEFETAVRHGIPLTVVVANDAAWGIERHFQHELYGTDRMVATSLGDVRWDRMAEAMGGHGEYVTQADELAPALQRALACGGPACVNVKTRSVPSPLAKAFTRMFRRERGKG